MKKRIYSILGGQEKLISEEVFDSNGNCTIRADYSLQPVSENHMEYDSENNLLVERVLNDGVEMNRTEYEINSKNEVIRSSMYFGDSIYEESIWERTDTGFTKITTQDGIIVEKVAQDDTASSIIHEYYEDEKLVQTAELIHDPVTLIDKTVIKNLVAGTEFSSLRYVNGNDDTLSFEEFDSEGKLLRSREYVYDGDLIESETQKEFEYSDEATTTSYTYDPDSNLVKYELRTTTGNLLSFMTFKYNDKGQEIEQAGSNEDRSGGGYGSAELGNKFHRRIEYIES